MQRVLWIVPILIIILMVLIASCFRKTKFPSTWVLCDVAWFCWKSKFSGSCEFCQSAYCLCAFLVSAKKRFPLRYFHFMDKLWLSLWSPILRAATIHSPFKWCRKSREWGEMGRPEEETSGPKNPSDNNNDHRRCRRCRCLSAAAGTHLLVLGLLSVPLFVCVATTCKSLDLIRLPRRISREYYYYYCQYYIIAESGFWCPDWTWKQMFTFTIPK